MNSRQSLLICILGLTVFSCTKDMAPETTPPWTIGDLTVRTTPQAFYLRWTATGDDGNIGRASQYEVRYAASNLANGWESAHIVPSPPKPSFPGHLDSLAVNGIGLGPWEFGIKIADERGNWSAISNIVTASIDTMPPSAITDLTVRTTVQGFYLRWTAPLDDGATGKAAQYQVRYAASNLGANWDTSPVAPNAVVPATAGHPDSATVLGIGIGPWEVGIKSVDASGNWSAISNVVVTTIPDDVTPPAAVTDLTLDFITEKSVILLWTAPGDDGETGQVFGYDVRYSQSPITPETWDAASRVQWVGTTHQSGERELFTIPNLQGPTDYFALKALDEVENASDLSNSVSASISSPVQLTFNTQYSASNPDWSPNGQLIVFGSTAETQSGPAPEVYVVPATGGSPVQYTSLPDGATSASWSPDGMRFALSLYVDQKVRTVLGIMNTQPEGSSQVLADPGLPWKSVGPARWSPDGSRIAYNQAKFSPGEPTVSEMHTVPSSGGISDLLVGDGVSNILGLDWSPDGTQIIYSSNQSGAYHLWVIPTGGGPAAQLTTGAGNEINPAWSPDGTKIAFGKNGQMWVVYSSGEDATQVTFDSDKSVLSKIAWSPDGTMVAYSGLAGDVSNIWTLRVK
jgi:Tol biopolymer transport system component